MTTLKHNMFLLPIFGDAIYMLAYELKFIHAVLAIMAQCYWCTAIPMHSSIGLSVFTAQRYFNLQINEFIKMN